MEQLKIGITHGYTNGVGYEVILRTFENPTMLELCTPVLYGSPKLATYHRKAMELSTNFCTISRAEDAISEKLNIIECFQDEVKVEIGQKTEEAEKAMSCSRQAGLRDVSSHLVDALVAAPGDKLEPSELTILINDVMRVAVLTDLKPLKQVSALVTEENVTAKLRLFSQCLRRDFGITRPRIAVLSLNPEPGTEENEVLAPVVQKMEDEQICAIGPLSAEQLFGSHAFSYYDGILAMYYDQAAAPLQMTIQEYCVALQADAEHVKTFPLQDAGLSQAGKGEADLTSFCKAIYLAIDVCRNRARYDGARQNPLPKLFHDKREDNKRPSKAE